MTSARPPRPLPIPTRVRTVSRLSAGLVRVVLHGLELGRFADPVHADSYVKIVFPVPGVEYARPIDPARVREEHPAGEQLRLRTYTVRAFDRAALELTLDVVVHGERGIAGPWAAAAQPGDEVLIMGPGGGYDPDPDAGWHLLAGDESALPAIAVALERMPPGADVHAFVEVSGPTEEIPTAAPVTWLHRGDAPVGAHLNDAVRAWPTPAASDGQAFVHGEAAMVRELRRHLRLDRGLPLERLSISGYWRVGVDDEGWRAVKRDWNRAVEESEQVTA